MRKALIMTENSECNLFPITLLNPNLAAICRKHNVPYDTAIAWKTKNWWYDISEDILQNHKEELLAKQRAILERTYDELGDRLDKW